MTGDKFDMQKKECSMNIKVSVLVTFYNQAHYVDRALQSVIDQNRDFNIEILVGDDGSTDDTVEKVNVWMQRYPEVIKLYCRTVEEREPIARYSGSKNRLNLLSKVKGDYFIFLDGDDYYIDNTKLDKQVKILDCHANKDCVACAHLIKNIDLNGTAKIENIKGLKEGKIDLKTYWKNYYFHTDTMLIRSSIVSKLPLELLEFNFHDNLITFSILQNGSIYYLPICMAVYNNDGAGLWTGNRKITNLVITMMNYDMYNIINPLCEKITSKRFAYFWKDILKARKEIDSRDFILFEEEAQKKNLMWFEKWIHYNDLPRHEQFKMISVAYRKAWKLIMREKGGAIYHKFLKRKNENML